MTKTLKQTHAHDAIQSFQQVRVRDGEGYLSIFKHCSGKKIRTKKTLQVGVDNTHCTHHIKVKWQYGNSP